MTMRPVVHTPDQVMAWRQHHLDALAGRHMMVTVLFVDRRLVSWIAGQPVYVTVTDPMEQ